MQAPLPHLLWISVLLSACGGPGDESPSRPDAGPAPLDAAAPPPCELAVSIAGTPTAALAFFPGQHRRVEVAGSGWASLEIREAPSFVRAEIDGTALDLVADYGGEGAGPLVLVGHCPDRTTEVSIALTERPLPFQPLVPWSPGVSGPLAREYFAMWIDPTSADRLWVVAGFQYVPAQFTPARDVWSLDLTTERWTAHGEVAPWRAGATVAVHPEGYAVMYGGLDTEASAPRDTPFSLFRIDTVGGDLTFTPLAPAGAPDHGDYQPSFFYHPPSGRFIAACGMNDVEGGHCKVSALDLAGDRWSELRAEGPAPAGRNGHFWAYDAESDRLLVFSGEGSPPSAGCTNCLHDTWELRIDGDTARWSQLDAGADRLGRRNGAFVWDPAQRRLLIWGGTSNGRTTRPGLWAFEPRDDGGRWTAVPTDERAPGRTSGAAVFDNRRGRALLGFGNGAALYSDLWSLPLED